MQRRHDSHQSEDMTAPGSAALSATDQALSSHREAVLRHLDRLAKPPGSLGRLEELAGRLCTIQGTLSPRTRPRRVVIFVADHGVVDEGVSAWPSVGHCGDDPFDRSRRGGLHGTGLRRATLIWFWSMSAPDRSPFRPVRATRCGRSGPEPPTSPGGRR